MIEYEKTYLAKYIPTDLCKFSSELMVDIYLPQNSKHPNLRIRKKGDSYTITRKGPINRDDTSIQVEHTIIISREEFLDLDRVVGRRIHKIRYQYPIDNYVAEFDVFEKELEGLVLVDIEFEHIEEKQRFNIPEFCLVDVTQVDFVAGGVLAGKTYSDIEQDLKKLKYKKLFLNI
jgi:CYTH domain-containing protein